MASLLIRHPDLDDRFFPLGQHQIVLVGRDDQCTVQVLDDQISRRHFQIHLDATKARHLVHDYESANGVYVNGRRVMEDTTLSDGDRIRAGRTTLVYLVDDHDDITQAQDALRKMDEWKRDTVQVENQ